MFLSSDNLKDNYKYLVQRVQQRTGINITKYNDMDKQFNAMAKIVAKKTLDNGGEGDMQNLSLMNSKLIDHATNFFCEKIANKVPSPSQSPQLDTKTAGTFFNSEQGFSMLANNDDISGNYSKLLSSRSDALQKNAAARFDQPIGESSRDVDKADQTQMTKLLRNMLLERGQVNEETNQNILPFNIDDEVSSMMSRDPGADLPLYQNIMDLQTDTNIMDKLNRIEKERQDISDNAGNQKMLSYKDLDVGKQQSALQKMTGRKGESNLMLDRNNTDSITYNQQTELSDPKELFQISKDGQQRMIDRMTNGGISGNDIRALDPLVDNILTEKILSLQRDLQPKYTERMNYIVVNSLDRDWYNSDRESRYSFKVNFRPSPDYLGAGIVDLYRNVTSVELVNALIPQDCVNIPFDARIYIDILNFPYLLLQIPEFSDVFRGTNSHNDRAFSVLVFDKQHDSSVLSSDYISGSNTIVNSAPTTQFYREYRKTYYKYTPAYFEKKVYYNSPLASLSHMTLNLATPAGENLNTMSDVLSINNVDFTALNTVESAPSLYEYKAATSYPNDNTSWATRKYVRLNTNNNFSNKLYRLGDLIRIKGFALTSNTGTDIEFTNFMNREEGHYILNTDYSNIANQTAGDRNEGYTANIYIAPPGNLNGTFSALDTSTYISSYNGTYSNKAKLINVNLQTHYLFKIATREGDVSVVTKPMNV